MKTAFYYMTSDHGFVYAGHYANREEAEDSHPPEVRLLEVADLYKVIQTAKEALNNIPVQVT